MKSRTDNINILIIDDDANIRQTLSDILTEEGYKITDGGSIAFAKKELIKRFYNIVLVDIKLSNGSGLELLKEIKRINEETMVIVFTGLESLRNTVSALNENVFAYLQKPFNIDELKITIKKALKMQFNNT